jgi:hypothetical protein
MSFLLLVATSASSSTLIHWGDNGAYGSEFPAGLTNVVRIVSSAQHTLALKADGTLETVTNFSHTAPPSGVSTNVMTFEGGGATSAGQNNAANMQFFRLRKTD